MRSRCSTRPNPELVLRSDRPVHRPEDLKNLKLRVPQSEVMVASFKAIGAAVGSLPFPELYTALSSGAFQAEENPIATVLASNFDKVQHYLCLTGHVYSPAAFLVSKRVFDRLSPHDRRNAARLSRLKALSMGAARWRGGPNACSTFDPHRGRLERRRV